jgi:LytS/YehU family sensor histidine kinase
MKLPVQHLLPIVLSVFLPVLNLISSLEKGIEAGLWLIFFQRWLSASVILYLLWHALRWGSKGGREFHRMRIAAAALLVFLGCYPLVGYLFPEIEMAQWTIGARYVMAMIVFLIIQYALHATSNIAQLQLEKEQMQTETYKAQLEALRAKVDPHFLFNSLNTLRTLVRHGHEQAESFVLSLSDFYRQTLKYNEDPTIRLFEEIHVLKAYLFLMKSRNEEAVHVEWRIDEACEQYLVPTLALQAVVENCFKHNTMSSKDPLHICIETRPDYYLLVKNNLQPRLGRSEPSGQGLMDIQRRYDLLKVRDGLRVEQSAAEFCVWLKLL